MQSRPWLRSADLLVLPGDGYAVRDARLTVCPICGMPDIPSELDVSHLGAWPCHGLCKEWLGDWQPPYGLPTIRTPFGG